MCEGEPDADNAELLERASAWRRADPDPETAAELGALVARRETAELAERFTGGLIFGTAGLRGILGAGPSRMNRAVMRLAVAALAQHLRAVLPDVTRRGVVVGHDARRQSPALAAEAAAALCGAGVPALVLPPNAPTPLVPFAVRRLDAAAGLMITASHNPPEYNGCKVYWEGGLPILAPHDAAIARLMAGLGPACSVPVLERDAASRRGLRLDLDPALRVAYLEGLAVLSLHPGVGRDLRIVYTPLHGVGGAFTPAALQRAGFGQVHVVAEQAEPDGTFPTVRFPNPEEPGALDLALALAEAEQADLVLANDPDADRLAVAARASDGRLIVLTGNEVGVLLGHHRLTHLRPRPARPLLLSTIVSSPLLGRIAEAEGALYDETPTGFKWLAARAEERVLRDHADLVFAYEEALGYALGPEARDKDGIGAALAFADLAGWCRASGRTVFDELTALRRRYGVFLSAQRSLVRPGRAGARQIAALMARLRQAPPTAVAGLAVVRVRDFLAAAATAPADVLAFDLEGGARVVVRPSGTEPKAKVYFDVEERVARDEDVGVAERRARRRLESLVETFELLTGPTA